MHVENGIPGLCPTDSWTAIVKASGGMTNLVDEPVAANIYELIQKKGMSSVNFTVYYCKIRINTAKCSGADYCQRFAVQF